MATTRWGRTAIAALALALPLPAEAQAGAAGGAGSVGRGQDGVRRVRARREPGAARPQSRPGRSTPRPVREALARNPLIDFVFLNLEGAYDRNAVMAMSEGLGKKGTPGRKTLLVRIPSLVDGGPQVTGQRIKEILAMGADGITVPHVENLDQGRQVVSLFTDARANVWSAANPGRHGDRDDDARGPAAPSRRRRRLPTSAATACWPAASAA